MYPPWIHHHGYVTLDKGKARGINKLNHWGLRSGKLELCPILEHTRKKCLASHCLRTRKMWKIAVCALHWRVRSSLLTLKTQDNFWGHAPDLIDIFLLFASASSSLPCYACAASTPCSYATDEIQRWLLTSNTLVVRRNIYTHAQ